MKRDILPHLLWEEWTPSRRLLGAPAAEPGQNERETQFMLVHYSQLFINTEEAETAEAMLVRYE